MSEVNNCVNCKYWVCQKNHKKPEKAKGICRRFPPTMYPNLGAEQMNLACFLLRQGILGVASGLPESIAHRIK